MLNLPATARRAYLPLIVLAALLFFPLLTTGFYLEFTAKVMILAIFALSLQLLVGVTGLVSLGHAAFYGIAAYATVLLSPKYGAASLFWILPTAVLCSALYALAVGALSLRTKGVYFIMVTLAFAQMAYYVFHDTKLGGGTDGIYLNFKPDVVLFGTRLVDLGNPVVVYYLALACLALVFVFLALLLESRFGRVLAGIKSNEQRMRAAGFTTFPYKWAAFTLAGALAGLAGVLVAVKDGFVNPEMLSWHESGAVLLMLILGGTGRLSGAVLGAFAFALLQLFFQWEVVFGNFARHWPLLFGATIIICVATMPEGLIGLPAQWRARRARRMSVSTDV
ncbi:MAG: branched-chain amino acid ABC transporter permease [Betaproteobacteria bacterium]